ncbi:MAG: P1 family peptidase [Pseudomonadota bacterium]|nr:P1 family peptidase [Pseudomonadota bacterium]
MAINLAPDVAVHGETIEFDWPALRIGCAEYAEGPTGVTAFVFPNKAKAAVDVRGGLPGSYNTDFLKLGYDLPTLDAIGVSGGSWYGLQAISGIAAAMKADGYYDGQLTRLANVAGAIIYDYGDRRLNEVCPDVALGAAAYRAARAGVFPLGAHGAGRMAVQGMILGHALPSGQGGAFRQIGAVKIAAFAVANPVGLVCDRKGRLLDPLGLLPEGIATLDQALAPMRLHPTTSPGAINPTNTTISLIVTNLRLPYSALNRLGVQVHAAMARSIQPFACPLDGDVLFAASTDEVDDPSIELTALGTIAADVMREALENVTRPRRYAPVSPIPAAGLDQLNGEFVFGEGFSARVASEGDGLTLVNTGARSFHGVPTGQSARARLGPDGRFSLSESGYPAFRDGAFLAGANGAPDRMITNLGAWQQTGRARSTAI